MYILCMYIVLSQINSYSRARISLIYTMLSMAAIWFNPSFQTPPIYATHN